MEQRTYQAEAIQNCRNSFGQGTQSALLVMPTGAGKTVVFSKITENAVNKNNNVLILVHRRELIKQASKKLAAINVDHGIIAAKFKPKDSPTQIASVQTLVRRLKSTKFVPSLIIIDEAHHAAAGSWEKILNYYPDAIRLGVTATPCRLDGRGLKEFFDDLILGPTIPELVKQGYLSPHRVFAAPKEVRLSGLKTRAGDYARDELAERMKQYTLIGDTVENWRKNASGLPTVAFCVDIDHAEAVTQKFIDAGIKADIITGDMNTDDRDQVINDLSSGSIQVLVSVDVVSEGFDLPIVSCAILLRPTQSEGLYMQQVGRILRPGKDKVAIVLDHVGNTRRHGFVDDVRNWSLDSKAKSKRDNEPAPSVTVCDVCFATYRPQLSCPSCGAIKEKQFRQINEEEGELIELKREEVRLDAEEKTKRANEYWGAKTLQDFLAIAKRRGYKTGWAYHAFKNKGVKTIKPANNILNDKWSWGE
jgi:DNA repair protein RadD